jgi:hypothetical protein
VKFKAGDWVCNDFHQIAEIIATVDRDPNWKCAGYRIVQANTGTGDGWGTSSFLSESIAAGWRPVAKDWSPIRGGKLEERWTYDPRANRWDRELRRLA